MEEWGIGGQENGNGKESRKRGIVDNTQRGQVGVQK